MLGRSQSIIVQIYLARRAVGPILRRIILFATYLIATVAYLANTGAGIFGMFYSANISTTYGAINFNLLYGIFLWLSAATDIILTGALVYSLRRHIIGFSDSTDSSLRRIINLAMRTAAFTSFISTLGAIFSTSFPSSQISTINALFAFTSPLGSLYALSLVATLASKRSLADGDGSGPKHTIRAKQILSGIHVQHEVVEAVDLGEKEEAPSRRMWQKDHSKIEVELEAWGSPSSRKSDQE
ncbi:hypothetical protein MNV49_003560 [Pseudohyphozyma bogoriensis]|nr:hypothetical protein MNV49_003560 [Pseudohyphozyma bogoriensis]